MEKASQSFESDSGEQASTNEDVESSHQWTTDFEDDEDSETDDRDDNTAFGHRHHNAEKTDSNDEDSDHYGGGGHPSGGGVRHSSLPNEGAGQRGKRLAKGGAVGRLKRGAAGGGNSMGADFEKPQVQSDTETRNLLDDIGDFDEDYLDLQEAFNSDQQNIQEILIDSYLFELTEDQYDYYARCFLQLLDKTQGHTQVNGALNGSDFRVMDFFRKSQLDNTTLSNVWALADANEDGFLNLTEFIIAMHLIVLHLKANIAIPTRLPSPIKPPRTPVRQLIRLANGGFATIAAHASSGNDGGGGGADDLYGSTTTTSAASSSNSATNIVTGGGGSDGASSRSSNNSQQHVQHFHQQDHNQQNYVNHQQFPSATAMSTSLELHGGEGSKDLACGGFDGGMTTSQPPYAKYTNTASSYGGSGASMALANTVGYDVYTENGADFTDGGVRCCSSAGGVKQHSLSDDHLHLHAQQRDIGGMAKFSDVPPVLVDSHPTALNATNNSTTFTLTNGATLRGPPPQPPPREYTTAAGGGKGHGRSASLDLKTFSALSPSYPPKSPHLNYRLPSRNGESDDKTSQPLETLDEDLSQIKPGESGQQFIRPISCREQTTQTEGLVLRKLSGITDYEEVFSSVDLYENLSSKERCKILRKLNDELENERLKLAQVRLQLQLRIEEAEEQLQVRHQFVANGDFDVQDGRAPEQETATSNKKLATKSEVLARTKEFSNSTSIPLSKPTAL